MFVGEDDFKLTVYPRGSTLQECF